MTEGTSNNAYIVKDGKIITRALSTDILHGITRAAVLRFAREAQMEVVERSFTIEEAQSADEAFFTSRRPLSCQLSKWTVPRWARANPARSWPVCVRSIWTKA